MIKKFVIFFFILWGFGKESRSQNGVDYADSVIYYFTKSKQGKPLDSMIFIRGIKFIDSIPADEATIDRIHMAALDFKNTPKPNYYYQAEFALLLRIDAAHEYYRQIDFGTRIIEEYEKENIPAAKTYYIQTLFSLRIPFRSTDKFKEGFDFYTNKLKKYYPQEDSSIIAICFYVYGGFYLVQGLGDRAAYYIKKAMSFLNPADTVTYVGGHPRGISAWLNFNDGLSNLYNSIESYKDAVHHASIGKGLYNFRYSRNDTMLRSEAWRLFAIAKLMLNENDIVLEALDSSLSLALITKSPENSTGCLEVKGRYFLQMNLTDSAESYLQETKRSIAKYNIPQNSTWGFLMPNYYLAQIRIKQKKFKEAEDLVLSEIPKLVNLAKEILKEKKLLVSIYLEMGDTRKASETYSEIISMQDELYRRDQKNRVMSFENEQELEKLGKEKKDKELEVERQRKQKNFYLVGAGMLALLSVFVFLNFRNQKKIHRLANEVHAKEKAELELQSLRAQLNPHFMFNSLNAIQELILLEENEKSQSYLARFAKLLRLLLENADKPFIPLQRELDFLQLYLSLENLRIPDLQFSINIAPNIDTEEIQIPNMILQPYIENAIWHGLSHKPGDKKLLIRITSENGFTKYEIEDNGVGRKRSAELKSLYRKEHRSKGMELLSKRFRLLAREYGAEVETTITDIMSGKENGTIVTIKVPNKIKSI